MSSLKQKISSKLHHQKTDTTHMTGKNTDLPATRNDHPTFDQPKHNPGYTTATSSSHFDNSQKTVDPTRQNVDHIIRQDSEEGLPTRSANTMATSQPSFGPTSGMTQTQYVSQNATDLNRNGIPDQMERRSSFGRSSDLNGNGVPDNLERRGSYGQSSAAYAANDLNRNGIPDNLERQGAYGQTGLVGQQVGGLNDLNRNGVPDDLERRNFSSSTTTFSNTDLNRNGIPDRLESNVSQPIGLTSSNSVETIEHITRPAIVHEVIRAQETREIQPIVERSREQTDVYEVVQPMRQVEVMPTEVRNVTLAPKFIPIVRETELIESEATIPVQIVRTVHVPVSQLTAVTTTRMMTAEESRSYTETQMSSQFATGLQGGLNDRNGNGIPDNLEGGQRRSLHDLNGNGIPDRMEKAHGLRDLNGNGIDDSLERRTATTLNPNTTF